MICIKFENIAQQQDMKQSCKEVGVKLPSLERQTAITPGTDLS